MTNPPAPGGDLETVIQTAFLQMTEAPDSPWDTPRVREAVHHVIASLDAGQLRVATCIEPGNWQVHAWIKQAILLYFRLCPTHVCAEPAMGYDKIPLKFQSMDTATYEALQIRVVPPATARYGSYIGPRTVLMPSYVNIGAYVGPGCMVDTWATVGSCVQIGAHVHLSGGVGIGGVLEPPQSRPTIIEDGCFIGARSEIVEGVVVGTGSVISMGVYISQSTRIYDRQTGVIHQGYVPPYSVVVPGALPATDGTHSLYAAIIVKTVDAHTRAKVSINALLRD